MKKHTLNTKTYHKHKTIIIGGVFALGMMGLGWLAWTMWNPVGVFGVVGLVIWAVVIENSWLKLVRVRIDSPKLTDVVRILQISDFHSNAWTLRPIIRVVKRQKPDLVVLTGDIFDGARCDNRPAERLVSELSKISPTMIILGNHETEYPEIMSKLDGFFEREGAKYLGQDFLKINDQLVIFGNDYAKNPRFELDRLKFNLLLAHSPKRAEKVATHGYDLILCGHEHGGQVRLPLIGALINSRQKILPELRGAKIKGLRAGKTPIYICSGAGFSAFPVRFFNRVQVSLIEISPKNEKAIDI